MKKSILFLLAIVCLAGCAKRSNQSTTDENVEVTKIYNLVILDRSGSMMPLREVAVQGYNETLDVIRRINPGHTYLIHMSDRMGLHADSPKLLPEGVELAYDGLIVKV